MQTEPTKPPDAHAIPATSQKLPESVAPTADPSPLQPDVGTFSQVLCYGYNLDKTSPNNVSKVSRIFNILPEQDVAVQYFGVTDAPVFYSDSEKSEQHGNQLACSVKIEGVPAGPCTVGAGINASDNDSKSWTKDVSRLDAFVKCSMYEVSSVDEFGIFPGHKLSPFIRQAIVDLDLTGYQVGLAEPAEPYLSRFADLENKLGQFYVQNCRFGGLVRKTVTIEHTSKSLSSSHTIGATTEVGVGTVATTSNSSDTSSASDSKKMGRVTKEWSAQGGDTTLWLDIDLSSSTENVITATKSKWVASFTPHNLFPFDFTLRPTHELLATVDSSKAEAFRDYLEKKWSANTAQLHPDVTGNLATLSSSLLDLMVREVSSMKFRYITLLLTAQHKKETASFVTRSRYGAFYEAAKAGLDMAQSLEAVLTPSTSVTVHSLYNKLAEYRATFEAKRRFHTGRWHRQYSTRVYQNLYLASQHFLGYLVAGEEMLGDESTAGCFGKSAGYKKQGYWKIPEPGHAVTEL